MDVTVVVATFGDQWWARLAQSRAVPSAQALGVPVISVHRDTLHDARNAGLEQVTTEWVVHLDADDQLAPGYMDAMATGTADVRAPAVSYIDTLGRAGPARIPNVAGHRHDCEAACLPAGNWLVIGAAVRAELVRRVGGWRDFPWSEDYSTWLRCYLAGASFEAIPQAVYVAHVRRNSRNRGASREVKMAAHFAILADAGIGTP